MKDSDAGAEKYPGAVSGHLCEVLLSVCVVVSLSVCLLKSTLALSQVIFVKQPLLLNLSSCLLVSVCVCLSSVCLSVKKYDGAV